MTSRVSTARVAAGFAVVYLVWGATFLAMKFALVTLPPFLVAGLRNSTAGALLLAWSLSTGTTWPTMRHWRSAVTLGALFFLCNQGGIAWSQQSVPSGLASVLVATVPLWIVVLDVARGVRTPSAQVVVGLVVGFAGTALLVARSGASAFAGADLAGTVVLTGSAIAWAVGTLYSRGASLPASVPLSTSMAMLCGGGLLLIVSAASGELGRVTLASFSAQALGSLGYLIAVGSLVGFSTYMWLLRVAPVTRVATYAYVNPVIALVLGWWLGGEALSVATLGAAAVSLFGVFLVVTARN